MLSTLIHKVLPSVAVRTQHILVPHSLTISRAFTPSAVRVFSSNIAWSHGQSKEPPFYEPHVTIQRDLVDTLESCEDMYENEISDDTYLLPKSPLHIDVSACNVNTESKVPDPFYEPHVTFQRDFVDTLESCEDMYENEISDDTYLLPKSPLHIDGSACKVNTKSKVPDFICAESSCRVNPSNAIDVPPPSEECVQGPCIDLNQDSCFRNVYGKWMVREPIRMGCRYGRSCPVPLKPTESKA